MKRAVRNALILSVLVGLALLSLPGLFPIDRERETVSEQFVRCGQGSSFACVVDGDSIRLGKRRIRVLGIDAPELRDPQCEDERRLAERSSDALLGWLNRGAFDLVRDARSDRDQYGRDLRRLVRADRDGREESAGDWLIDQGLAAPYLGRKTAWC